MKDLNKMSDDDRAKHGKHAKHVEKVSKAMAKGTDARERAKAFILSSIDNGEAMLTDGSTTADFKAALTHLRASVDEVLDGIFGE